MFFLNYCPPHSHSMSLSPWIKSLIPRTVPGKLKVKMLVTQLSQTHCHPMGCSLPGSCLWDSPDNSTRVGCYSLLQRIFPTEGLNQHLLYYRQTLYHLSIVALSCINTHVFSKGQEKWKISHNCFLCLVQYSMPNRYLWW